MKVGAGEGVGRGVRRRLLTLILQARVRARPLGDRVGDPDMEGGELVVDHGGSRVAPKLGRVLVEQRGDLGAARRRVGRRPLP